MQTGDIVNAILIFVLVAITAYYAIQTRRTVLELQSQRALGIRPVIIPNELRIRDPEAFDGKYSCIQCELKNIGNGPALKIHLMVYDPETEKRITTSLNFIDYLTKDSVTDDSHAHIGNKELEEVSYKQQKDGSMISSLRVVLHYEDIYGSLHFSERMFTLEKGKRSIRPTIGTFDLQSETIEKLKRRHNPPSRIPQL